LCNVWKLELKPSEEDNDEVEVKSITLEYRNGEELAVQKHVDLSGFVVHLPG
jgi:hypothetical protein